MTLQPSPTRLLSLGSIIADLRIDVPGLPPRGGDVLGSQASISAGGGFNILAAAARNGLKAVFGGRHGTGPYGDAIRMALREEGIGALMPVSDEGDSGFCVVLVEPDGERTFITSPGVEAQPGAIADVALDMADALFVSGYDLCYPELGAAIAARIAMLPVGVYLAVDPGPLVADIPLSIMTTVLARADLFTLNQREASLFAGTVGHTFTTGNILSRLRPAALMIIRNGSAGCVLFGAGFGQTGRHVSAPLVHMIDSTGAGDAHTGVFLASLAAGLDAVQAARRANAAAAFAVTRKGPATAPRTEELDAFLAA